MPTAAWNTGLPLAGLMRQTTANFKQLCIGDQTNAAGVKLAYAGSGFHRCIKG